MKERTSRREWKREPPAKGAEPSRWEEEYRLLAVPPANDKLQAGGHDPEQRVELESEAAFRAGDLRVYWAIKKEQSDRAEQVARQVLIVRVFLERNPGGIGDALSFSRSARPLSTLRLSLAHLANWSCALVFISSAFVDRISLLRARCFAASGERVRRR